MLLSRDDSGSGSKTEQSVALLEQKWHAVSSKMEERKVQCMIPMFLSNLLTDCMYNNCHLIYMKIF